MIAGLYFTKERNKFLVYSDIPILEGTTVIITRKGKEFPFNKWDDLADRKGGSVQGDSWGEEFDGFIDAHLDVENVHSFNQNVLKLLYGRIDYIIATQTNAKIASQQPKLAQHISTLPNPVNKVKIYIAFAQSSPFIKYLPQFNRKLREMIKRGEVEKLREAYFAKAIVSQGDFQLLE